jgi:hypothetical protein
MVTARVARYAVEAASASSPQVGVGRYDAEAAAPDTGSDTIRAARVAVEVMAKSPTRQDVGRYDAEAAAPDTGSDTIRVARVAIEGMSQTPSTLGIHRVDAEAAAPDTGLSTVRAARVALEVMTKVSVPQPIPLDLNTDEFFASNWEGVQASLESSYLTDVTRSPDTLCEERRSLGERPARNMRVLWTQSDTTHLDRLMVFLRDMTSTQMQVPLYPDGTPLTADSLSASTVISLDTERRRFFAGARVILAPVAALRDYSASPIIKTVASVLSTQINLTATVGQDVDAGEWIVFPLIDCDIHLGPQLSMPNDLTSSVEMRFTEHKGRNSLPPIASGLPTGWQVAAHDDKPIFVPTHDWASRAVTTYRRHGRNSTVGRKVRPAVDGERYVQVQSYVERMTRADFWPLLALFDSRRGSGRSFWAIDLEHIWTLSDTDTNFIDVLQQGVFADFDQHWTDTGVAAAIVMKDGTIYHRKISTVQDNGGSWRLTLAGGAPNLPDPIDLTQVDYFARARHSKFDSDSLPEKWYNSNVVETSFSIVETPNEQTLDLDP